MSPKLKKVRYRMVPSEFVNMPHNKEELAQRIKAHRERLEETFPPREPHDAGVGEPSSWASLLSGEDGVFPRSKAMRYIQQNPKVAAFSGTVGAALLAVVLPKLFRRVGYQRLLRWGGVLSPLVLTQLEKMQAQKTRGKRTGSASSRSAQDGG